MLNVKLRIFPQVTTRDGTNDRGYWKMHEQQAQIGDGIQSRAIPFNLRLEEDKQGNPIPYKPGEHVADLMPDQGRFKGSLQWDLCNIKPASA